MRIEICLVLSALCRSVEHMFDIEVRPHVTVVIDINDLPGSTRELVEMLRYDRRYRGSLSRASLELLLCDCDISRVLMAGESEVLDVGRATRTVTRAQRKALVAHDRHCTAHNCHAPPERCEAHHRSRWDEGGPTDIENLELLCWTHHRERHRQRRESEHRVDHAA